MTHKSVLTHPDRVQAECQHCNWSSPAVTVDYSNPNGLWAARSEVTNLHRTHAELAHPLPRPRITHLLTEGDET